jgi:hypothetical protein
VSHDEVKSFISNRVNYGFVFCSAKQLKNIEVDIYNNLGSIYEGCVINFIEIKKERNAKREEI